jgi:hypothetical protein
MTLELSITYSNWLPRELEEFSAITGDRTIPMLRSLQTSSKSVVAITITTSITYSNKTKHGVHSRTGGGGIRTTFSTESTPQKRRRALTKQQQSETVEDHV